MIQLKVPGSPGVSPGGTTPRSTASGRSSNAGSPHQSNKALDGAAESAAQLQRGFTYPRITTGERSPRLSNGGCAEQASKIGSYARRTSPRAKASMRSLGIGSPRPSIGASDERASRLGSPRPPNEATGNRASRLGSPHSSTGATIEQSSRLGSPRPSTGGHVERSPRLGSPRAPNEATCDRSPRLGSPRCSTGGNVERSSRLGSPRPSTGATGERSSRLGSPGASTGATRERTLRLGSPRPSSEALIEQSLGNEPPRQLSPRAKAKVRHLSPRAKASGRSLGIGSPNPSNEAIGEHPSMPGSPGLSTEDVGGRSSRIRLSLALGETFDELCVEREPRGSPEAIAGYPPPSPTGTDGRSTPFSSPRLADGTRAAGGSPRGLSPAARRQEEAVAAANDEVARLRAELAAAEAKAQHLESQAEAEAEAEAGSGSVNSEAEAEAMAETNKESEAEKLATAKFQAEAMPSEPSAFNVGDMLVFAPISGDDYPDRWLSGDIMKLISIDNTEARSLQVQFDGGEDGRVHSVDARVATDDDKLWATSCFKAPRLISVSGEVLLEPTHDGHWFSMAGIRREVRKTTFLDLKKILSQHLGEDDHPVAAIKFMARRSTGLTMHDVVRQKVAEIKAEKNHSNSDGAELEVMNDHKVIRVARGRDVTVVIDLDAAAQEVAADIVQVLEKTRSPWCSSSEDMFFKMAASHCRQVGARIPPDAELKAIFVAVPEDLRRSNLVKSFLWQVIPYPKLKQLKVFYDEVLSEYILQSTSSLNFSRAPTTKPCTDDLSSREGAPGSSGAILSDSD